MADGKAEFFKGQWVWVKIREELQKTNEVAEKELGVVRLINGKLIDGYYAIDGKRFRRTASYLMAVSDVELQTLNGMKNFVKFKADAVAGKMSTKPKENDSALGKTSPLICVGLGGLMDGEIHTLPTAESIAKKTPGETKTIQLEGQSGTVAGKAPGFDVKGTPPPKVETRGNAGVKQVLDMARQAGAKSADILAVQQGLDAGEKYKATQKGTSTTMLFLVGAAIAGFFLFRD